MYCSSCGVAVAQGLSYCNHCGAKVSGAKGDGDAKSSGASPASLVWAMVSVFVVGLGAIIALMGVMKGVGPFNEALIRVFATLSFLLMLAVEGVFIWLLLRRNKGAKKAGDTPLLTKQATAELGATQERLLSEPVPSVTEHTTRTFEPVYSERQPK